ncbi:MAG: protein kinase domain-containing protein [Thermoanaerobaculaceae bacterium]
MGAEPKSIGRFEIEGVLGRGAMGVVYVARDPVIGRKVALKTLVLPEGVEEAEEFRVRFLREAQAAGILNHPGIVTVYDAGVDEATSLSYIAMELVEGRSLRDLLRQGYPFSYSEVARIGVALAMALDYAHSKGVVHRDIKPANVLLTEQGQVKITDFGVARVATSNLTTTGQFIGTPNYMSPEQVKGSSVDGRSDLFSLGVVLFELLTGKRPFSGDNLTEVSYKIVHEPAPVPSQLRPGLPPAFNPIVLKLLEKNPDNRYQRGVEVARALEALRRLLSGASETAVHRVLEPSQPNTTSQGAVMTPELVATATRATVTEKQAAAAPAEEKEPSIWRLPIATRWVITLVAVTLLPPALIIAWLYGKVDRGPFGGPVPGEVQRRHQVAVAIREAAALVSQNPAAALEKLRLVWDQAPYSGTARRVAEEARLALERQQALAAEKTKVQSLLDQGVAALRQGQLAQARQAFAAVLEIEPDNILAQQGLELARGRSLPARPGEASVGRVGTFTPTAAPAVAGRLEFYFNSPLSQGEYELQLDGSALGRKTFDFRQKGFLGIRQRGSGIVEDSYPVPAGSHKLFVRLKNAEGRVLGEQTFTFNVSGDSRWVLKVEMFSEKDVPRFSLSARK